MSLFYGLVFQDTGEHCTSQREAKKCLFSQRRTSSDLLSSLASHLFHETQSSLCSLSDQKNLEGKSTAGGNSIRFAKRCDTLEAVSKENGLVKVEVKLLKVRD